MRVTTVELHEVDVPDRPWAWSDEIFGMPAHRRDHVVILVVHTDAGIDGLGEVNLRFDRSLIETEVQGWIGLDPLTLDLAALTGSDSQLVSERLRYAFECAVLDIRGKALGCPVGELLGGRVRGRVAVSLCTGYKTVENTARDAVWGWEQGFRTYKMKCIVPSDVPRLQDRVDYIVERVDAIHREVPQMAVRPDIRRRLVEVWAAEEVSRRLAGHCLDCLEDPITSGARAGTYSEWRRLRERVTFPVAEHCPPAQVVTMWAAAALDYAIIGGLAQQTVRTAAMVEHLGLEAWTQSVGLGITNALALHVCAAGPGLTRPSDIVGFWAKEDDCVVEAFPVVDGSVAVPQGPGLGVTLDTAAVARYAV